MIPVTTFAGRRVAVFGLGSSGIATCRALLAGGAEIAAFDDDPRKVGEAAATGIPTADLHDVDWTAVAALVLSPGVPLTHPAPHWTVPLARSAGLEVIGDIELYCRERRARAPGSPFVAVTGTNGKSTTTALTAHVLATGGMTAEAGGNIGIAVLSLEPARDGHAHVVECSSYQIDLAPSLDPAVGILLNITPDHLDRHGTLERYAAVKEQLIAGVEGGGTAVVGVDDDLCRAVADRVDAAGRNLVRVSVRDRLPAGLYLDGDRIVEARNGRSDRAIARLSGIGSLRGLHNAQNAAASAAAALALGIEPAAIQRGLSTFPGLAHRMEQVGRRGHVLFINDSKATNAEAAARALASFPDIFWIVGGVPKSGGIDSLTGYFPRVRKAYLIGQAAPAFAATLDGKVAHVMAGTLDRAIALAASDAQDAPLAEPVVLLSPACASFDQFPNFEVRGSTFRELVHGLGGLVPVKEVA
jgi:UDP-N-acetylmuramoylalanine--D-glutamate ligase